MAGGDLSDLTEPRDVLPALSLGHPARLARSADGSGRPVSRWEACHPPRATGGGPDAGRRPVGVARVARAATAVGEPAPQGAVRRPARTDDRRRRELPDDHRGVFTGGEPALRLATKTGPGVAPGKVTGVVPGTDPGEMAAQRVVVTPGHRPSSPPHRGEACDEVPPAPPPLELHAPMSPAQPHRYPMRQMVPGPHPLPRPGADRAHRRLPDPWTLVMTRRHRPDPSHLSPSRRTPGCVSILASGMCRRSLKWQWSLQRIGSTTKARVGPTLRSAERAAGPT